MGAIDIYEGDLFMKYFEIQGKNLLFSQNGEMVMVSPWGENGIRVRSAFLGDIDDFLL